MDPRKTSRQSDCLSPYSLSLRLWHPVRDPQVFCDAFGWRPSVIQRCGESRKTPAGTLVKGQYDESYCAILFDVQPTLGRALRRLMNTLLARTRPLASWLEDGGRISCAIGLDASQLPSSLEPETLNDASKLGLSSEITVYAVPQRRSSRPLNSLAEE